MNLRDDRAEFCLAGGFCEGVRSYYIRPTEQDFHAEQKASEGVCQFMKHPG